MLGALLIIPYSSVPKESIFLAFYIMSHFSTETRLLINGEITKFQFLYSYVT